MVAETRSKARKESKVKPQPSTTTRSQRSLRDMFASSSKLKENDSTTVPQESAIEVLDSSSEAEIPPLTPEPVQATERSDVEIVASATEIKIKPTQVSQRPAPKKLFSIFERPKVVEDKDTSTALQETDTNVIHLSDSDSCTEEPTPYQRKPGQHLFSVSSSSASQPSENGLLRQGSSRDLPIVVDTRLSLRPSKSTSAPSSKPVYSIFAPKQNVEPKAAATISGPSAPFPDKEGQHVYGTRTRFIQAPPYFPRSAKGKEPMRATTDVEYSLTRICSTQSTDSAQLRHLEPFNASHSYIDTIPRADQAVPAISVLLRHVESAAERSADDEFSREKWTDKWRPRRAEHVLGNEAHALYLRDWLMALRLQGNDPTAPSTQAATTSAGKKRKVARRKKPRIVRHVKKRRARGYDDGIHDFLASDESTDFEEEPLTAPSSDFDELGFSDGIDGTITGSSRGSSPLTPMSEDERPILPPTIPAPRRFGRQLMNTILLAGPSGSGKTAAVHACAEELGYEVFEVYPGMGDRNGASLHKLIGDVGKNHVVKMKRQHTPGAQPNFFRRARSKQSKTGLPRIPDSSDIESVADELDIISSEPDEPPMSEHEPSQPAINQSLILVEEVDILYQTDSNFWPALINIIKECKRPVILTCNDVTLVPCLDLPLQETLWFQPCESSLASSYLQALCLAEGRPYPRQELTRIYDNFDPISTPIRDLRHAIDHLQFYSTKIPNTSSSLMDSLPGQEPSCIPISQDPDSSLLPVTEPSDLPAQQEQIRKKSLQTLRDMDRIREVQSFVDSHLSRETNISLWNLHLNDSLRPSDNELGYTTVYSDLDLDNTPVSPYHAQDESIVADLLQYSRQAFLLQDSSDKPCTTVEADGLEFRRRVYLATAGTILRSLSSSHVFASDAALHLDFAPTVRDILNLEQFNATQQGSQGRSTRNSQRTLGERWLPLSDAERDIFRTTRLQLGDFDVGTA